LLYSEQRRKLSLDSGSPDRLTSSQGDSSDIRAAIQSIAGGPQPFATGGGGGFVCQYSDPDYDEQDAIDACEDSGGDYNLETCDCYIGPEPVGGGGETPPAPTVTFSSLQYVAAGQTATVTATVDYGGAPSQPVNLTLTTTTGTGAATFANGGTVAAGGASTQISATTTVTISGAKPSSVANNITLGATIPIEGSGTQAIATNPQSFSVAAIPINFATYGENNLVDGTMVFSYTWQSSSGNISDLASCVVGEDVQYPGSGATYAWPAPMVTTSTNPTIINIPGNQTGPNSTTAGFGDYNKAPSSYTKPYAASSFDATQILQWACPNYNDGAFYRFVPNIAISRSVSLNSNGQWQYQITKSGYSNTAVLPNQ
jgi:hypothetical protein